MPTGTAGSPDAFGGAGNEGGLAAYTFPGCGAGQGWSVMVTESLGIISSLMMWSASTITLKHLSKPQH